MPSRDAWEKAVKDHNAQVGAFVDQLKAADRELYALVLTLAFAFGCLAAIVYVQGRHLRELGGGQ